MARLLQPAFTRGEVSPALYARVDLALYQIALRKLRNMFVRTQGGVSNRAGTKYVAPTRFANQRSVLIPFIFSTEQAYILEFSAGSIRVFANGDFVASTAPAISISNVTLGIGLIRTVQTSIAHGLVPGATIKIQGVRATGSYNVNGVWNITSVPSPNTFTLTASLAAKGAYFNSGQVVTFVEVLTPYLETDLADLRFAQSADVLTVVHKNYPQSEFRRLSANSFTFTQADFPKGPFLDANVDYSFQMHAGAAFGATTVTVTRPVFVAAHIGSLLYLESRNLATIKPWEPGGIIANATEPALGVLRRSEGKVYRCVTNVTPAAGKTLRSGSVRPVHERGVRSDGSEKLVSADITEGVAWEYLHSGFGIARITAFSSSTSVSVNIISRVPDDCVGGPASSIGPFAFVGNGITTTLAVAGGTDPNKYNWEVTYAGVIQEPELYEVDINTDVMTFFTPPANGVAVSARQLSSNNRTDVWALGSWSVAQGYPSLVTYFQDRIIYAASREQPQTVWASRNSAYKDFGTSTPIVDDDALNFTLNAREINTIRDLLPLDNLVALTSRGAFKITDGENEVLTPSTVGFKPQSFRGAKRIRSILVGDQAVFVHEAGREIRSLGYRYENDKFTGVDLSIAANHLLKKNLTAIDMDYAEEPHSIIHVVREDGVLLHLTFEEEQEVTAWGHSDTLNGAFERVCVIPENGDSAVYVIVRRTVNGQTTRHIERLADREFTDVVDGVFVDASLSYDGRNSTSATLTLGGGSFEQGDTIPCTSSVPAFDPNTPPDQIRLEIAGLDDDGELTTYRVRCNLVAYVSPTQINVTPVSDVPVQLRNTPILVWAVGFDTFSGLNHLEGAVVTACVDGSGIPDQTITGGQLELDYPAYVVHVGFRMTCEMESLDINIVGAETVRDVSKHIAKVAVVVQESRNVLIGQDADHLDEVKVREPDDEYDLPSSLLDGVHQVYIAATISENGRFLLRHDEPLPLTVLAAIPRVEFGTDG